MKAAVLREVDLPLEVEEVEIDRPGPREVLIRTGATRDQGRITQMAKLDSFAEQMLVHEHAVVKVDDDGPW